MRKGNIKINVYLNEEERKMLEEKSNKAKLSHSDFIRNLIEDFKENSLTNQDINYIANNLLKLKKRLHYLGYFEDEEFLQNKLSDFNFWISKLKK